MNIFRVLVDNLRSGPSTLRYPRRMTPSQGYRGLVQMDPQRCVGCAACVYVCSPSAIMVEGQTTHFEWRYQPGQCTFCGRCVEVCPVQALEMESDRPPIYTRAGELQVLHRLAYPLCPECGQVAKPVNDVVLALAFDEVSEEIRSWSQLCERCRSRHYQPALISPYAKNRSV